MLVVESLVNKKKTKGWERGASNLSNLLVAGNSLPGRVWSFLGGVWGMFWDQTTTSSEVGQVTPLTLGYFDLDRLQPSSPSPALNHINVGVHADGPTRVLSIVDARNKEQNPDSEEIDGGEAQTAAWWSTFPSTFRSSHDFEDEDELYEGEEDGVPTPATPTVHNPRNSMEVQLVLHGIGVSVVESTPRRELLYLSILDVRSEIGSAADLSRVVIKVGWIQVDNQLYGTYYPVMFAPRSWNRSAMIRHSVSSSNELKSGEDDDDELQPFAEFCLVRSNKFPSLDFVRYISVLVLPMNLKLEPELLGAWLDFISRCSVAISRQVPSTSTTSSSTIIGSNAHFDASVNSLPSLSSPLPRTPKIKSKHKSGSSVARQVSARDVVLSGGREAANYYTTVRTNTDAGMTSSILLEETDADDIDVAQGGPVGLPSSNPQPAMEGLGSNRRHDESSSTISSFSSTSSQQHQQQQQHQGASPSERVEFPTSNRKLYIEELHIHPVKVHVSFTFRSSKTLLRSTPQQQQTAVDSSSSGESSSGSMMPSSAAAINPIRFALNAMGATFVNVENAPLRLNALVLHNSLSSIETVMGRILAHYRSQALRQAYLILGSVDLLGDPRGLVKNLGAGVLDFFYEPALGLVKSPKDFGAGIAKGTTSLFRRIVLGAATSATGFANGVSALFDSVSNDRYTGFKPKTIAEGFVQGVAGLVVAPMNGFQEEGLVGFGQGAFYGVIGLFVKPLAGVLKLVKRVSVAIQSTVDPTVKYRRNRMRPPRHFRQLFVGRNEEDAGIAQARLLEVYNYEKALGEQVIALVDQGMYLEEGHVGHLVISTPDLLKRSQDSEDVEIFHRTDAVVSGDSHREVVSLSVEELQNHASYIFTFYTVHEKRPFRKLPLWNPMFVIATRCHLLYVRQEETNDYDRSTFVVGLDDVLSCDIEYEEQVVDEDDDDVEVDDDIEHKKVKPNLSYWIVRVKSKRKTFIIYTWTKTQASQVMEFVKKKTKSKT